MIKSKYNLKVALLSNDNYGENLGDLKGANYITGQIRNYFVSILRNPEEDIIFLKNINYTDAVNELYEFISKIGIQDNCIFIFYFCGHGKALMIEGLELILALRDTNANNYGAVGIKFKELVKKIKESNIKRFICIIDSCCSGIINSMGENESSIEVNDLTEGSVYISSVNGTLKAYEVDIGEIKVPWFSYCFWRALMTLSDGDKTYYSINDIFEKTKKFVFEKQDIVMKPGSTYRSKLYNEEIFPKINEGNDIYDTIDVIDWRITNECNNKCGVCYACNDNKPIVELSEKDVDTVIRKLSRFHHKAICISGGEPTQSKYFIKILSGLYREGFSIFLSTNGYKYMEYQNEIEECIDKLSLPLDGYDEKSNCVNGRDAKSFSRVKFILDFYKQNKPNFPIKISTVLTRKTNNINYLSKIMNLLNGYNISIWKIYEFIPENRGLENKEQYLISRDQYRIKNWVDNIKEKGKCDFRIEFVRRKERNAAYFIIQANGDVIIPIEANDKSYVEEKRIGNIVTEDLKTIISLWNNYVDRENYKYNIKLRKIKQLYLLEAIDKKILLNIISRNNIPSLESLSKDLQKDKKIIMKHINALYENRIIKRIIPIINLNMFGIHTYLATIKLVKSTNYPEGYFEDYLCYNAHIGWVTKCENNTYRIAIFAKKPSDASKILQKIQMDLNYNLNFEFHDLSCSYAIGEKKILTENRDNISIVKYNSSEQDPSNKIELSYNEFYALKQIEELRKPLKENIDKKTFLENYISINENIELLKKKGVIEQLSIVLDTRVLGYDWYLIFIQIPNDHVDELIEFLRTSSNNITHINLMIPHRSKWNLDFEVHSSSFVEVDELLGNIEQKFNTKNNFYLKIIRECKFSFLTHSVLDIIKKNYIIQDVEGDDML